MRKMSLSSVPPMLLAVLLSGLAAPAQGDCLLRQLTHTDAFEVMGTEQPARDDTSVVWLAEDKASMTSADNKTVIVRADRGMFYMVDHGEKTYSEMPLEDFGDIKKMAGIEDGDEEDELAQMMQGVAAGMMSVKIAVTPTDEEKKIREWKARKYIVETAMPMGSSTGEVWASEEIDIDLGLYQTVSNAFMAKMAGFHEAMKEMEKVKGLTVKSVQRARVMGTTVETTTELLEYSEQSSPTGAFDIPDGYKKVDLGSMGEGF